MGFWGITKDCLTAAGRATSTMLAVLEEFNIEQDKIEPFKKVKRQWQEYLHVSKIALIVVPDSYESTLEVINVVSVVSQKIIGLMDASIEEPKQRDYVLKLINECLVASKTNRENIKKLLRKVDEAMEEAYSSGLSKSASLSDKIRYILDMGSELEAEEIMSERLPSVQQACRDIDILFGRLNDAGVRLSVG